LDSLGVFSKASLQEMEEKHKKHEKLHEPGHKAQLEEVWQEQDQMQQEFDPKTFFMLHDVDSNGLWDQDEVKALFIKELEKMYVAGEPEDDMRERAEEMERMRESVFKEVDVNRDGFIDYEEFLAQTKRNDFQQDHGWQGLDERRPYTDEELQEYIRQHQAANQVPYGYPPPHPGYAPPPMYQQVPPGHHPNGGPVHPGGVQMHPGQVPPQQFHPGQVPQQHPQQLQGRQPDLNTNEVYPQHNQPNYQHHQQVNYQQAPPQPNYQHHPPQQAHYQPQPPQQPNYQQVNYQQAQAAQQHQIPVQNRQAAPQAAGNVQQGAPQGNVQQGVPQGNVQQGAPQGNVQQGVPQGNVQQGAPQGNVQQGVPQGNVQQGAPQGNIQQGAPQGNVQQGAPQQGNNPSSNKQESPQANQV
jgi:hypothetical protein